MVEDEAALVMTVGDRLEAEGYQIFSAPDGTAGFDQARNGSWDLILLDLMLPGKNGFDICRDLRAAGVATPVLMLTARSQVLDRVVGLKLGADDYLCKPFDMDELVARVEALLRRGRGSAPPQAGSRRREDYGDFLVDFSTGTVELDGQREELSAQEYKLLEYLTGRPGEIISRDELLDAAWGYGSETSTRTVDVHVAWIRRKIGDTGPAPRHIQTVRGLGYRFVP